MLLGGGCDEVVVAHVYGPAGSAMVALNEPSKGTVPGLWQASLVSAVQLPPHPLAQYSNVNEQ